MLYPLNLFFPPPSLFSAPVEKRGWGPPVPCSFWLNYFDKFPNIVSLGHPLLSINFRKTIKVI